MRYVLSIIGIILAFFMVKKRESLGDMLGDPEWSSGIGGIYNLIVVAALFIFFWSIATITGTTDILFYYVFRLFSVGRSTPELPSEL